MTQAVPSADRATKMDKPYAAATFLLPVFDRWLFFAPLSGSAALVNGGAAHLLRTVPVDHITGDLGDFVRESLADAVEEPRPRSGPVIPSMLGIIPTRGCNMSCSYCHFGGPSSPMHFMRPEIGVAGVDWAARQLVEGQQRDFCIQFFGGEPFVARDLVETIVHRARYVAAQYGLTPIFDASTNGFYGNRTRQFIGDYFDAVVLSLDGPAHVHDRTRPAPGSRSSFATVERTARFFSDTALSLCLRMCVTQESVVHMEEIVDWMIESFHPSTINFETLTPGERAAQAGLAPPDPYLFARHAERSHRLAADAGIRTVYAGAEISEPRLTFCPVGRDAVILAPDGRISACYLLPGEWQGRGLDLNVGSVDSQGQVTIVSDALDRVRRVPQPKPRCLQCFCRFSCAGGCHVNQTFPGCTSGYTDFCVQTRILTACRLLRDLGFERLAEQLIEDRAAMSRLALHESDGLVDDYRHRTDWRSPNQCHTTPDIANIANMPQGPPSTLVLNPAPTPLLEGEPLLPRLGGARRRLGYRIAPGIRWSVELRGLLVSDANGESRWIAYPEAALWDSICQSRPWQKTIAAMSVIAAVSAVEAEKLVRNLITKWLSLELIEPITTVAGSDQSRHN